jgi:hypothetical protein
MPLLSTHLSVQQLRKANQHGWLYAIGGCSITDGKADFDAMGIIAVKGCDDQINERLMKNTDEVVLEDVVRKIRADSGLTTSTGWLITGDTGYKTGQIFIKPMVNSFL